MSDRARTGDGSRPLTLELHYFRGKRPNFGDDLNGVLWPAILPEQVWNADAVLVGIGSILTEPGVRPFLDAGRRTFVVGSGVSYGPPPRRPTELDILAVRGPLSAAAVGVPSAAATDGAYLVADAPSIVGAPQTRNQTLLVPHHRTLRDRPWQRVASEAGMTFVSPELSVEALFDHYARAELVVTEAMHGAIIADALRIPWIPITISPQIDEFKWRDWLGSVELDYNPISVPAPDHRDVAAFERVSRELRRHDLDGHRRLASTDLSPDQVTKWLERRYSPSVLTALNSADAGSRAARLASSTMQWRRPQAIRDTVGALQRAASSSPSLSRRNIMSVRMDQLRNAVDKLTAAISAG